MGPPSSTGPDLSFVLLFGLRCLFLLELLPRTRLPMESQPPPSPSPLLPWEVIERIISYSHDSNKIRWNSESIRNFSLTCRELRPRSLCFLVADAVFSGRNKIFDFCDLFPGQPSLEALCSSITVHPDDFAPVPLLHILPNLSKIEFTNNLTPNPRTHFNQHVLTCCHLFSTHIQSLSLSSLAFATSLQFFRALLAFPRITHLVCPSVLISKRSDPVSVHTKQRLSQRLRLLRLHISYWDSHSMSGQELGYPHSLAASEFETAGTLLMDSGVIPSTVESLVVELLGRPLKLSQQLDWPRLRSLTLTLRSRDLKATISYSISLLKNFYHSALKKVTVEVQPDWTFMSVIENIERHSDLCKELEDTLLRFSQAQVVWTIHVTPIRRNSLWLQDLGKHFSLLFRRGALTAIPKKGFCAGHATSIKIFSISSDSKWAASGSGDNTIILWNTANGAMVHRWSSESHTHSKWYTGKGLSSLSFSSDSKYLVSGDDDNGKMAIWNVSGGVLRGLETRTRGVTCCAWSPRGDMIAFGCKDGTVKLWDTNTFERLRVFEHATANRIDLIEFSPNGRRLLTGCRLPSCSYYLWNIASSTGKQLRTSIPQSRCMTIAAVFDPGSTRFVIVSPRLEGMVEILDAENVEEGRYVVLGASGNLGGETRGVAFSPDGKLVLTVPNHRVPTHTIRIWDAFTGMKLLSLEGHDHEVSTACFSPGGKYVASASEDGTVRLWRTSDGSCIATLSEHGKAKVGHVVFSPDGKTLCSGAEDGSVIIRQMRNVLPTDEQDT